MIDEFPHRPVLAGTTFLPSVDVYETADSIVVVVDIAGASPDSLRVVLEGRELIISGERQERCLQAKQRLLHMEIDYGFFERRMTLPPGVGTTAARARYEHGFLFIEMDKSSPPGSAGRIPIE